MQACKAALSLTGFREATTILCLGVVVSVSRDAIRGSCGMEIKVENWALLKEDTISMFTRLRGYVSVHLARMA